MSDDQTASAGSEPTCRPGSTPGRGTSEDASRARARTLVAQGAWTPSSRGGLSAADVPTVETGETDADEPGRD